MNAHHQTHYRYLRFIRCEAAAHSDFIPLSPILLTDRLEEDTGVIVWIIQLLGTKNGQKWFVYPLQVCTKIVILPQ